MTHSNTVKQENKLLSQFRKKNQKAALFVKDWGREKTGGVIHYCPELDGSHFQKTWGQILKTFFSKLLNKRS